MAQSKSKLSIGGILMMILVVIIGVVVKQLQVPPTETTAQTNKERPEGRFEAPFDPNYGKGVEQEYLFCFWNVENFFDDVDDGLKTTADQKYDTDYAADNGALAKKKVDNIATILAALNGGKGPDILALAEVENEHAAEMLGDALNDKIQGKADPYKYLLYKDPKGARHIATVVLSRVPAHGDRTQLLRSRLRILQGDIEVNGHQLVVVASHWTSRLQGGEDGRDKYADLIYGSFNAMYKSNPAIDFLVCGDFNDTPEDDSVRKNLHATGNKNALKSAGDPMMLDLMGGLGKDKGTHWYNKEWFIFDHLVVSPGLLDPKGWSVVPDSTTIVTSTLSKTGRPIPFDEKKKDGYSDHLPVTVKLKVQGK